MGDIDGSSSAARSARSKSGNSKLKSFNLIARIKGLFLFGSKVEQLDSNENSVDIKPGGNNEVGNLLRLSVQDVAIPKADIVAVQDTITKDELFETFKNTALTRLPIYENTLDRPLGFIHFKDFILKSNSNDKVRQFHVKNILRTVLFVPPSMSLGVLLAKMQAERTHMALVIDEYGGVDGLVTIEDLIEQVVGDIEDEHDEANQKDWFLEKPGQYLATAKTSLREFKEETGLDLKNEASIDAEEIGTFGGLVFMLAGRVPVRGEIVPHPQGMEFEIVEADPRRVKKLRLRLPDAIKAAE
ncbi:MAG: CBS domain-containing protein [Rhodobacteraceae bacterium]|nr:CBS domain-containing protein [Paracoccaceae bacterium]